MTTSPSSPSPCPMTAAPAQWPTAPHGSSVRPLWRRAPSKVCSSVPRALRERDLQAAVRRRSRQSYGVADQNHQLAHDHPLETATAPKPSPSMISNPLTGLAGGKGVVRIQADLDESGAKRQHRPHECTEAEGWTQTLWGSPARLITIPISLRSVFTGTVASVSGQDLVFAGETISTCWLPPEGPTIWKSPQVITRAIVSNRLRGRQFRWPRQRHQPIRVEAPFNTLTGAPSATLAGDRSPSTATGHLEKPSRSSGLGASGSQSTADQIQVFAGGAWTIYWLYDANDADPPYRPMGGRGGCWHGGPGSGGNASRSGRLLQ